MSRYTFHSRGPVRMERMLVGTWQESAFPGQSGRFVTEEIEVSWLRQDDTEYAFFWDGKLLKKAHSNNDYYGPLRSFDREEAEELARKYELTPADRLEVRATCRVYETPVRPTGEVVFGRPEYEPLGHRIYTGTPEVLAQVAAFRSRAWKEGDFDPATVLVQERTLAEQLVWSSRSTPEENAALWEAFRARFEVA